MDDRCTGCGKQPIGQQKFRREQLFWKRWVHCPECRLNFENRLTGIIGVALLILAIVGILMASSHEFSTVGFVFINAALFELLVLVGTLPHELGHAIVGRSVGLLVLEVSVGRGRDILFLPIAGFRVHIRLFPIGGLVMFGHYPNTPNLRRKYLAAAAAGPAINLALALIALPIAFLSPAMFTTGIPVAGLLVCSQLFVALFNLVPCRFLSSRGIMIPSDGLSLFQLLFSQSPEVMGTRFETSANVETGKTTTSSSAQQP